MLLAGLGGWLAVDVVVDRGQFGTAGPSSAGPALPHEFARGGPKPSSVESQPAGRAIAAYLTDDDESSWWVVVGADRRTLRQLHAGPYLGAADATGTALLSPSGRFIAMTSIPPLNNEFLPIPETARVSVVDLVTGDRKQLSALRLQGNDAVLAWSADERRIAVRTRGTLTIADVSNRHTNALPVQVEAAAFHPDGGRLAVTDRGRLTVVDLSGQQIGSTVQVGRLTVAPAGWSPDGRSVALRATGDALRVDLARLDVASGTVRDERFTNGFAPMGWRANDVLVGVRDKRVASYDLGKAELTVLAEPGNSWVDPADAVHVAGRLMAEASVVPAGRADRGAPWIWYCVVLAAVFGGVLLGPEPSSKGFGRHLETVLVGRALLGYVAAMSTVLLVPLSPVLLYLRPDLLREAIAAAALGAAAVLAGRAFRPRAVAARAPQPRRPLAGAPV